MKTNIITAILTILVLANTEAGAIKIICWLGLFIETVVLMKKCERISNE